ncbi:DNA-3-methyladenine glycosylase I [Streptomyces sp. NPDC059467]|uniref:DNA-3-methyladenine glycosylase I n=1 Tax=Streptomyces sp. NPDC059467 TaxID=3346844 RepID=UPI003691AA96
MAAGDSASGRYHDEVWGTRTVGASPHLAGFYERTRTRSPRSLADLPATAPESEAFARRPTSQGHRFAGPVGVYSFIRNVGVVNDHPRGCLCAAAG